MQERFQPRGTLRNIPKPLWLSLKAQAAIDDLSLQEVIRRLIQLYLLDETVQKKIIKGG